MQDYISRYETDIYRYSNQYIRFKKQQWNALQTEKENDNQPIRLELDEVEEKEVKNSFWNSLRRKKEKEVVVDTEQQSDSGELKVDYNFIINNSLTSQDEKQLFLDALLPYQLRWASSTIKEKSFLDQQFKKDSLLKYFLQRFPDTYFLMYKPIFLAKQAPIQLENIFITPMEILCITVVEEGEEYVYLGDNGRFWTIRGGGTEKKLINPQISLTRMARVVQNIVEHYKIEIPIKKIVLCETGYIDFPDNPFDIMLVDKRTYKDWFEDMRKNTMGLKHSQLKVASKLLQHCQSTFVDRPEWK